MSEPSPDQKADVIRWRAVEEIYGRSISPLTFDNVDGAADDV